MLNGILRDQRWNSNEDLNESGTVVGHDLTFDEAQRLFQNWMRGVTCIIENRGEHTLE
jgi:hypothetical protein